MGLSAFRAFASSEARKTSSAAIASGFIHWLCRHLACFAGWSAYQSLWAAGGQLSGNIFSPSMVSRFTSFFILPIYTNFPV